jgi:Arc/MetJ family transcription regulator
MRTTLDLDDELMGALLARFPGSSKTHAVETAIRAYLTSDSASRLRQLAGSIEIEDLSEALRKQDRAT